MSKIVDYYAGLSSPWTYLGHKRFCDLAKKSKANVNFKPVDFGVIFPATGGLPLAKRAPERQKYRFMELERWRKELNVPLNLEPKFFPVNPEMASRMCIALDESSGNALGLAERFMQAVWAEDQNLADPETLTQITDGFGLDGKQLLEQANDQKYMDLHQFYSEEAIDRGVFGAPSYVIEDEVFWGQDRLNFVEKKLGIGI